MSAVLVPDAHVSSDAAAERRAKTNKKRVLTERRREQNRASQRKYRERRKANQQSIQLSHVTQATTRDDELRIHPRLSTQESAEDLAIIPGHDEIFRDTGNTILNWDADPNPTLCSTQLSVGELPQPESETTSGQSLSTGCPLFSPSKSTYQQTPLSLLAPISNTIAQSWFPTLDETVNLNSLLEGIDTQNAQNLDSLGYNTSDSATQHNFGGAFESSVTPTSLRCSLSGNPIAPSTLTQRLPSVYMNHLRIPRLNLYAACLANAVHLGIPVPLAKTEGFISPFYQLSTLDQPTMSLSMTLPSPQDYLRPYTKIKPDLQPSSSQINHSHELYIDLFPFPLFRERVINMLSLSPPPFDENELKRDLDSDGLMCWGSMSGKGSGTPWDSRSWEAQGWFLRKWWMLTKDSEVDSQSRWWRSMRGEEDGDDDASY